MILRKLFENFAMFILFSLIIVHSSSAEQKQNNQCLENKVREMLMYGLKQEDLMLNPGGGAGVFYFPGVAFCQGHGSTWPSGGAPCLVRAFWERETQQKRPITCPRPFSPVKVVALTPRTGCRPVSALPQANACALSAYVGDEETNPQSVEIQYDNGITDLDFFEFAKAHMSINRSMYPEVGDCY